MTDLDKRFNLVDEATPLNEFLSAHYKRGFAYFTIRDRLPVILTTIIDNLSRDKEILIAEYGENCRDDLKEVIGNISKLKYELQTDKPFKLLEGDGSDEEVWNDFLNSLADDKTSYFSAVWLHAECYMYRRLRLFFEESSYLKTFDYFRKQKEESFVSSKPAFINLLGRLSQIRQSKDDIAANFKNLLQVNLWGNRIDLSISAGQNVVQHVDPFSMLPGLEECILADDSDKVWSCLSSTDENIRIIDLIHDNAGYELFTDLCLIDFILSHDLASKVRCHVKMIPWFVSDVMPSDFYWTIETLKSEDEKSLREFGEQLADYVSSGRIECIGDHFWTSPYDYENLKRVKPELHSLFSSSNLLIFKGDLNYRKLMGDINWPTSTPFPEAIRNFRPTNVCALRTIKADTASGLKPGVAEELTEKDSNWMETGKYGIIQFAPR